MNQDRLKWVHQFDCFLFDFDGLLVNTEHLHFLAYRNLCKNHGIELNWDYQRFCQAAHFQAMGVRDALYQEFPALYQKEPSWEVLYAEKKQLYQESLKEGNLQLMPGVETLLKKLAEHDIPRCVATHSPLQQVEAIKQALPLLKTIPLWITREDYQKPKPEPDSYLLALQKCLTGLRKKAVGFEDALRGLKALQAAQIETRILICSKDHPQMKDLHPEDAYHFESIESICLG